MTLPKLLQSYYEAEDKNKENIFVNTEELNTQEVPKLLQSYYQPQEKDISFSREFAYGTAQEPTAIGSAYRITKSAIQAAFDRGETYEEARERIENERQEKILEEFPEFRNRPETAGVISGRAAVALADPVTFLVPWAKAAKAGKIASLTTAGTFGATDLALREEALYGEIRPENVALGFGLGAAGGALGDYGMSLYNRAVKTKVKIPNEKGQMIDKDVDIPPAYEAQVFKDEVPIINQTINETLAKDAAQANKNLGNLTTRIKNIEKQRNEITESVKELEKQFNKKVNQINKIEDGFIDYSTYKTLLSTPTKKSEFIKQKEILLKQKKELNTEIKNIYLKEKPENLLDVTSKTMIQAFKNGVLTENLARGIIQETVRPLFGGIIGGGIGATFTEEGEGNEKTLKWALFGAGLGQYQKMIQRSEYKLIPKKIRNAANEEFIQGARRSFNNILKGLTAGSHVQDLMSRSEPVVNFAAKMFRMQGGGVTLGKVSKELPVEQEAAIQGAYWRNRYAKMLSSYDDDVLELAGKITNQKGLDLALDSSLIKFSFVSAQDMKNPKYAEALQLSDKISKYTEEFKTYAINRGLDFKEETQYGLTQILKQSAIKPSNYENVIDDLAEAFYIQRVNQFGVPKNTKKALNQAKKIAGEYLNTSTRIRNNSIWAKENQEALFQTNGNIGKARDEQFILQAARHFNKERTLFDQEARARVAHLFEQNPLITLQQLTRNTIPIAEFVKRFGSKGEGITKLFTDIDNNFKSFADPQNKFKSVKELYTARPGIKEAADREKQKIKDSVEAWFGVYQADKAFTSDAGLAAVTFLQTGLAMTRLLKVAIPSMGDWLQIMTNSGYKASVKALFSKANLSDEALSLNNVTKQVGGKDVSWTKTPWTKLKGRDRIENLIEREMADVLVINGGNGLKNRQAKVLRATSDFFEIFQLGRVTRIARNWAFTAGVERTLDISKLFAKGKSRTLLQSRTALQREISQLGLKPKELKYLSQFKDAAEAIDDPLAKSYLKRAGINSADRDALIPTVGNRRLFAQSKSPLVKFLGSFLSWAQAKTSQTNALISRVEDGDAALFLRMAAALPIYHSIRQLQVALSTNQAYKDSVVEESTYEKVGETLGFSGLNTFGIEKVRGILQFSDYSSLPEQIAPVLGYMNDIGEFVLSPLEERLDDDADTLLEEIAKVGIEGLEVVPVAREFAPKAKELLERDEQKLLELRGQYSTGGLVDEYQYYSQLSEGVDKLPEKIIEREKRRAEAHRQIAEATKEGDVRKGFEAFETLPIGEQLGGYINPVTNVPLSGTGAAIYTEKAQPSFKTPREFVLDVINPRKNILQKTPIKVKDPLAAGIAVAEATGLIPVAGVAGKGVSRGLKRIYAKRGDDIIGDEGSNMGSGGGGGRGGKGNLPATTLDEDINKFARDGNFVSPTIEALIRKAPKNIKGNQIIEYLNSKGAHDKGVKPKELPYLGIEKFITDNPNATLPEVIEHASKNKVKIGTVTYKDVGEEGSDFYFNRSEPEFDPIDGSPLHAVEAEELSYAIKTGDEYEKDIIITDFNTANPQAKVKSINDIENYLSIRGENFEDFIDNVAKKRYEDNPYILIEPKGEGFKGGDNTFVFGNDDVGYQTFINGERIKIEDYGYKDVAYSETEAKIRLQRILSEQGDIDLGSGEQQYKSYVDTTLPGGKNYTEKVYTLDSVDEGLPSGMAHFSV